MNCKAMLLAAAVGTCVAAEPAGGPLSAQSLQEYCAAFDAAPESETGRACISYVRGFIDGLSAVQSADEEPLSWSERAARTRLGRGYQSRVTTRTECLDDPEAMSALITRVLAELQSASPQESSDARQLLLRIIGEQSPCAA